MCVFTQSAACDHDARHCVFMENMLNHATQQSQLPNECEDWAGQFQQVCHQRRLRRNEALQAHPGQTANPGGLQPEHPGSGGWLGGAAA